MFSLFILGTFLAILVALQVVLLVAGGTRRLAGDRRRRDAEAQILSEKLDTARSELRQKQKLVSPWSGTRKFRLERRVLECADICSFYLQAHDKKPLPHFRPGQYLTFELEMPGRQKQIIRCYSLSDRPRSEYYRVTIKRIGSPLENPSVAPGIASNLFHDRLKEGDIVDVRAPSGHFCLDANEQLPLVLIGGGVGITPLLSMLNEIVETGSKRETWFFFGVRNSDEHAFKEHVERLARGHNNIRLHVCYSRPGEQDVLGKDYHHCGRVSIDLLKKLLPSNNYDFYICGPGAMMENLAIGLKEWNVPPHKIHSEAFGPASLKKTASVTEHQQPGIEIAVHFSRSGQKLPWKGHLESLLDLAETANIVIDSGCRAGNCGTCKVSIKSGRVKYLKDPGCDVEAGACLTCCSVPETEIVLDA
jgi:uncharacterized protein